MAGDTLPETQSPEGPREESFPKPTAPLPPALGGERPRPMKEVTGRDNTHTSQALSARGAP